MRKLCISILILFLCSCNNEPIQYTFSGQISKSSDGTSLSGVTVSIYQKVFSNSVTSNNFELAGSASTDANGHYEIMFERKKVTEFKVNIQKEGYFTQDIILQSADVSSENDNIVNSSMDGRSWAKFNIINQAPADANDNLTLIFYIYRKDCEGCIEQDYNYYSGVVNTSEVFQNTAENYLKFTYNDGFAAITDSVLMPPQDTVEYTIQY